MSNEITTDDRTLIHRFVTNSDASAFDMLVEKYSGKAFQIACGILNNREDAEEVAQDAFLRIYRALPHFRGDAEFSTWMYRIVLNLSRNKLRWNKVRGSKQSFSIDAPLENSKGDSDLSVELPDSRMDPAQESLYAELKAKTNAALEQLPEAYREAVTLRNVKEMSYEEIADILGCKVGTVKSRIARGREEIRRILNL